MEDFLQDLLKRQTYQAALAELVGTGLLTLAALLAGTPYAVALLLAALVYALGPTSGAQLNPAVTLGLLAGRRISLMKAVLYLDAQAVGALLAAQVAPAIGPLAAEYRSGRAVGEFVGAGLLVLTVMAVSDKWVPKAGAGVAIGAALGAGLLLTGGVLNPAVAMAMGLGRAPALWAPALGGTAFALLFALLAAKPAEQRPTGEGSEGQTPKQEDRRSAGRAARSTPDGTSPAAFLAPQPSTPTAQSLRSTRAWAEPTPPPAPHGGAARPAGTARPRSALVRALWSTLIGMVALPFALAGPLWRLLVRVRQARAHARHH